MQIFHPVLHNPAGWWACRPVSRLLPDEPRRHCGPVDHECPPPVLHLEEGVEKGEENGAGALRFNMTSCINVRWNTFVDIEVVSCLYRV